MGSLRAEPSVIVAFALNATLLGCGYGDKVFYRHNHTTRITRVVMSAFMASSINSLDF